MKTEVNLPHVARRILTYMEKIDESNGQAPRMEFLRIAGNEAVLNNWVNYLIGCNLIKSTVIGKRTYYTKTDAGQKLHAILKLHPYVGPLFEDLSRDRRHKGEIFSINSQVAKLRD
ncbi:MAG: hypothetical protein ACYCQJ_06920 [Nitrososphaerales archaeon]